MPQPFRFGIMSAAGGSRQALKDKVQRAEDLGYWSFLFNDHYAGPGPAMQSANHGIQDVAAIPTIALAAEATSTLKVGFRVLCVDYHQPVVLVKELATLDLYSEGRLEAGLGAGWIEAEYEAMGVPFDPPGIRIQRLSDFVDLLDQSFGDGEVAVDGRHGVRASGFEAVPKPVQRPRPPIAIGGGARRILQLAGRKADIVAFNINNATGKLGPEGPSKATAEVTDQRVTWVRDAAGDRFADIQLEIGAYFSFVTDDAHGFAGNYVGFVGPDPESVIDHPHSLIGTVDAICDRIHERRERWGFSYITILDNAMDSFAPVVSRLAGK